MKVSNLKNIFSKNRRNYICMSSNLKGLEEEIESSEKLPDEVLQALKDKDNNE